MYRLTARETRTLTAKEKIMPDNFGRMTSDEAPQNLKDFCFPKQAQKEEPLYKHAPGPWTIYNHGASNSGHFDGYLKSDIQAGANLIHVRQSVVGNTFPRLAANVHLMAAAPSMHDALWAIANMQVQEETDRGEVLALCMSIARLELEKCSTVGK